MGNSQITHGLTVLRIQRSKPRPQEDFACSTTRTFHSCWHSKMHVNRPPGNSTGDAIQGTSSVATKHEVNLSYKLSMMIYPCNNHDCRALNGPEKGWALFSWCQCELSCETLQPKGLSWPPSSQEGWKSSPCWCLDDPTCSIFTSVALTPWGQKFIWEPSFTSLLMSHFSHQRPLTNRSPSCYDFSCSSQINLQSLKTLYLLQLIGLTGWSVQHVVSANSLKNYLSADG